MFSFIDAYITEMMLNPSRSRMTSWMMTPLTRCARLRTLMHYTLKE